MLETPTVTHIFWFYIMMERFTDGMDEKNRQQVIGQTPYKYSPPGGRGYAQVPETS